MAKDILKSSISYTVLGFLPLSVAVIFTPIYTKYLGTTEYGILSLFVLYTGIAAQIIGLGVSKAFLYYYWDVYKEKSELKSLMSSTLGLLLSLQLIFISTGIYFADSILSFLVKSNQQFTKELFTLCLIQSSFLIYYELFCYFYRNENKLKPYAIISVGTLIFLTSGTIIGVIFLDLKSIGAIYGRFIGYGLIIVPSFVYFLNKYGLSFNWKQSKTLLIFSLPIFLNSIIGAFASGSDKLLIDRLDNLGNLGIYTFGLVFVTVMEVWLSSISNALSPSIIKFLNEDIVVKRREIEGLIYTIFLSVMLLIVTIVLLVYPVLELLIPSKFHEVTTYIPILLAAFMWRTMTTLVTNSFYIKKKTKVFIFNELGILILTFVLGYLGYQWTGILGITIALYLVKMLEFIVMYHLSKKVLKMPIYLGNFYKTITIISVALFLCSFFDKKDYISAYILYSIPFLTLFLFSFLFLRKEIQSVYLIYRRRNKIL